MEKKDIASLLAALCDRPLAPDASEPSSTLRDFCAEAAAALHRHGDGSPAPADDPATDPDIDPDLAAALIAAVHSGTSTAAERAAFELAATRSAAFRLDAQSALAFVDAVEQDAEPVPAHLVASLATAAARPEPRVRGWRLPAVRLRWRMAAACAVVLAAGALTSGLYLRPAIVERDIGPAVSPVSAAKDEPAPLPAVASRAQPVLPMPDAAKVASCPPAAPTRAAQPRRLASGEPAKPVQEGSDCAPHPVAANPAPLIPAGADSALADNASGGQGTEATVALRRAEAARRLGAAERAHRPASTSALHPAAAAVRAASPPPHPGVQSPAAAPTSRPAAIDLAR